MSDELSIDGVFGWRQKRRKALARCSVFCSRPQRQWMTLATFFDHWYWQCMDREVSK